MCSCPRNGLGQLGYMHNGIPLLIYQLRVRYLFRSEGKLVRGPLRRRTLAQFPNPANLADSETMFYRYHTNVGAPRREPASESVAFTLKRPSQVEIAVRDGAYHLIRSGADNHGEGLTCEH